MQLTKLHNDFWHIENAFEENTLIALTKLFDNRDGWHQIAQDDVNRDESHYQKGLYLEIIENKINEYFGTQCFANATQLWYDYDGYINKPHTDLSPNLSANVQIYLCEGNTDMGTSCCIDGEWRKVPYVCNSGYLMFNPTKHEHGMYSKVVNKRISVYQSYRITEEPSPIW